MVDVESALGEQAFNIVEAQRIAQTPADRLDDQPTLKMAHRHEAVQDEWAVICTAHNSITLAKPN
jgi:hypothetical protein